MTIEEMMRKIASMSVISQIVEGREIARAGNTLVVRPPPRWERWTRSDRGEER